LNAIWFDLIPQSITDQFIRELEMNTIKIPGLNLNAKTIDLKEGRFWESETEANWDKWKDNLLKFTEKMIYGEVNPKNSIFEWMNFKWKMAGHINPLDFYAEIDKQWLRTNSGWNKNTLRDNLRKPVEK
jgi:hypothetical protein